MQDGSITDKISKFLFKYRITPHTTTGIPPAELLMGRKLRSRLDLLEPSLTSKVQQSQLAQKLNRDTKMPHRQFTEEDLVYAENFSYNSGPKWLPSKVDKVTGSLSYVIELTNGNKVRRHVDHVKARENNDDVVQSPEINDTYWDYVNSDSTQSTTPITSTNSSTTESTVRCSTHVRKPPERYDQSTST